MDRVHRIIAPHYRANVDGLVWEVIGSRTERTLECEWALGDLTTIWSSIRAAARLEYRTDPTPQVSDAGVSRVQIAYEKRRDEGLRGRPELLPPRRGRGRAESLLKNLDAIGSAIAEFEGHIKSQCDSALNQAETARVTQEMRVAAIAS